MDGETRSVNAGNIHLRSITVNRSRPWPDTFPFNVPIIASLTSIEFSSPVTFLVGENGSGKSTFLEAIACAVGSIAVGSESVETDRTLAAVRSLANDFRLTWSKKTRRGFFMRSEDFFGYARRMAKVREDLQEHLQEVEREYEGRSETARHYARMPYVQELGEMKRDYGQDLNARSHGESYLTLFQRRFVPGGLYLLDEPEAPLSPIRQLSFLALLKSMVDQDAQLIIATHSPIIMAFPEAVILSCDRGTLEKVNYDELEHVHITKDFLDNPRRYLKHLLE